MRICYIVEAAGGGSGRCVLNLAAGMVAWGHDVTLIYAPLRAEPKFLSDMKAIEGLKYIPLKMRRAVGFHDITAAIGLYRLLKKNTPFDIIHSHSSKAGGLARLVGLFMPGAQVYTPHAFITMAPDASRLYGWIEWITGWYCAAIIPVSVQEKNHAIKLGIAEKKLHVIPNGIELNYPADRTTARRTLGYANDEYVIGFVGRLVPQKNPERAIAAFALIAKKVPQARLVMVGDGPLQMLSEATMQRLVLADRVRFLSGYNARDVIPGFDCLLCSSDYEGFPVVFLEALAAGVPIVTTPVGGADEAVISGSTGYIAVGFSSEELERSLRDLIKLQKEKLPAETIKKHAQAFTNDLMVNRTLDLYETILQ